MQVTNSNTVWLYFHFSWKSVIRAPKPSPPFNQLIVTLSKKKKWLYTEYDIASGNSFRNPTLIRTTKLLKESRFICHWNKQLDSLSSPWEHVLALHTNVKSVLTNMGHHLRYNRDPGFQLPVTWWITHLRERSLMQHLQLRRSVWQRQGCWTTTWL